VQPPFTSLSFAFLIFLVGGPLPAQTPAAVSSVSLPSAPTPVIAAEPQSSPAAEPTDAELVRTLLERNRQMEHLLLGSLQADATNAVIDEELEHMRVIRADISARRDKAQNKINVGTLVANVLSTAGTAMQFHDNTVNLGNSLGVAGGSAAIVLSLVGMHEQGGKQPLGDSPHMLENFLGHTPNDARGDFSPLIWEYLNGVPAGQQARQTRRALLIEKWRIEGKLDSTQQPVTQPLRRQLTLDDFNAHYAMLLDLKAVISGMKRDLSEQAEAWMSQPITLPTAR